MSNPADGMATRPSDQPAFLLRVLVVTQDRDLRERITAYPREHRCRAIGASDMPPVVRLESGQFSLVVLDVELASHDGFDVIRRVRADSDIPVIVMPPLKWSDEKSRDRARWLLCREIARSTNRNRTFRRCSNAPALRDDAVRSSGVPSPSGTIRAAPRRFSESAGMRAQFRKPSR